MGKEGIGAVVSGCMLGRGLGDGCGRRGERTRREAEAPPVGKWSAVVSMRRRESAVVSIRGSRGERMHAITGVGGQERSIGITCPSSSACRSAVAVCSTCRVRPTTGVRSPRTASASGESKGLEVIRGHQRSSEVIRGHQRSSEVIRGQPQSQVSQRTLNADTARETGSRSKTAILTAGSTAKMRLGALG